MGDGERRRVALFMLKEICDFALTFSPWNSSCTGIKRRNIPGKEENLYRDNINCGNALNASRKYVSLGSLSAEINLLAFLHGKC